MWQLMCESCAPWADQFGVVYPPASLVSDVLTGYAARGQRRPISVLRIGTITTTPTPVRRGRTAGIGTEVTSNAAATGILVTIEIWSSAGTRVAQQSYSSQTFAENQALPYTWNWRANVTPGWYTVKVGVSSASGAKTYDSEATTLQVVQR